MNGMPNCRWLGCVVRTGRWRLRREFHPTAEGSRSRQRPLRSVPVRPRDRGRRPGTLGLSTNWAAASPKGAAFGMVRQSDRLLHSRATRGSRLDAQPSRPSREPYCAGSFSTSVGLPPSLDDQQTFLADSSLDALGASDRPVAQRSGVRRTVGPALARSRALRRIERVRTRRREAERVEVSRLGH